MKQLDLMVLKHLHIFIINDYVRYMTWLLDKQAAVS